MSSFRPTFRLFILFKNYICFVFQLLYSDFFAAKQPLNSKSSKDFDEQVRPCMYTAYCINMNLCRSVIDGVRYNTRRGAELSLQKPINAIRTAVDWITTVNIKLCSYRQSEGKSTINITISRAFCSDMRSVLLQCNKDGRRRRLSLTHKFYERRTRGLRQRRKPGHNVFRPRRRRNKSPPLCKVKVVDLLLAHVSLAGGGESAVQ